jgi:predicted metal-dependent enzyme (double-stranded beta helix superfamily)
MIMTINNLEQFADQFSTLLKGRPEWPDLLKNGRDMLSQLVSNFNWFKPILTKLALDDAFLKSQWHSIDPNDIQIYRSPEKLFTVRAFIWEPNVFYPIHDHGAWGIVGAHINQIRERKFDREDDGSDDNYAEVIQTADAILSPGQTTYVLALNKGIHQMQAVNNNASVTIHVYGSPERKGYIYYFNPHNKAAHRMYPPSVAKKILAIRTLGSIPESWAEDVLHDVVNSSEPEFIRNEGRYSLIKLQG